MGSSFEIVDLRDYRSETLLWEFYEHLYLPAFPMKDEQEHPGIWSVLLWGSNLGPPNPTLHCLLLGQDLRRPGHAQIMGGHLFEYYKESSCGLLTYLVILPRYKGKSLARLLLEKAFLILERDASCAGKELKGVFAEANDPVAFSPNEDAMSPVQRLRILSRLGARIIDIPYVQPALIRGHRRVRHLLLLWFDYPGSKERSIPRPVLMGFLHELYRALGISHPEKDSDFRNMLAYTDAQGEFMHLMRIRDQL